MMLDFAHFEHVRFEAPSRTQHSLVGQAVVLDFAIFEQVVFQAQPVQNRTLL